MAKVKTNNEEKKEKKEEEKRENKNETIIDPSDPTHTQYSIFIR